jgi:hypothetical protein
MLTEYLAAATLQERAAELARHRFAAEAARLNRPTPRPRRRLTGWLQARTSRSRRAASTSGHSLSMME